MIDSDSTRKNRWNAKRMVIAGISLAALIALGWMLLVSVRESTHRLNCANNLKAIGLALSNYESAFGTFPYAAVPDPQRLPDKCLGWQTRIVPYLFCPHCYGLEEYSQIDYSRSWDDGPQSRLAARPLRDLLCPSSVYQPEQGTISTVQQIGPLQSGMNVPATYIGIAGIGKDAASLAVGDRKTGFFGYGRTTDRAAILDGMSSTMAVAEPSDLGSPWTSGGPATVRGLDPACQPYLGSGRQFGGCHPGGANVLFAYGSVRFVRDTIAPTVFEALATVAGGEQLPSGWNK